MENVFMDNYYHLSPEERALIMIEHNQKQKGTVPFYLKFRLKTMAYI